MNTGEGIILVVDDDRDFRRAVCAIIKSAGYLPVEETNPLAVLKTIIEIRPDLVMLDLYMPGGKGVDLVRSMKELEMDVPVVIVSGRVSVEDFQSLRDLGVEEFLAKPVTKVSLISKIRQILPQAGR